jgi:hypothetical protein
MEPNNKPSIRGFGVDSILLWHVKQTHGIEGQEFLSYVRRSVKATHPKGNRRFHDWFFTCSPTMTITAYCRGEDGDIIEAKLLREQKKRSQRVDSGSTPTLTTQPPRSAPESLPEQLTVSSDSKPQHYYHCDVCQDTKKVQVFNECAWCDGAGCEHCNQQGGSYATIPCHSCPDSNSFIKAVKNLFKKP